jgi:acetyl-CoA carboxylase biotin carboxyl carrier protein
MDSTVMDSPVMDSSVMNLTDADVTDILALLDSLPYDELDLETPRFRLTLRRTPHGWTQSTEILTAPAPVPPAAAAGSMEHPAGNSRHDGTSSRPDGEAGGETGAEEADGELVAVRAPLPGTFYRAPRPGAAPFVEVGSRVGTDTVIGIVETMKLMNSVHAGVAGTVAEFCVQNAEFAAHGATLLRIRADT